MNQPCLARSRQHRRRARLAVALGAAVAATSLVAPSQAAHAAITPESVITTLDPEIDVATTSLRYGAGSVYFIQTTYDIMLPIEPTWSAIYRYVPGGASVHVAGTAGQPGSGDGGPAVTATFEAADVFVAPDGTIYVADAGSNRVREIGTDGVIRPFAGNGSKSSSGDGGAATAAGMTPTSVAGDSAGNIYIGDANGASLFGMTVPTHVRKVGAAGVISTAFPVSTHEPGGEDLGNIIPSQLGFDASDNLYLKVDVGGGGMGTLSELWRIAPDGTKTPLATNEDDDPLWMINAETAVAPDGTVYVQTVDNMSTKLFVLPASGGDAVKLADWDIGLEDPVDGPLKDVHVAVGAIATDPAGHLYVTEGFFRDNSDAVWYQRLRRVNNPTPSPAAHPVQPSRILDTRPGPEQTGYTGDKPGAGATVSLQVAGRGGVPATGAAAVTMNVTLTESSGAGFVTVWPSGVDRPLSSQLNVISAGTTVANLVTVPIGPDGKVNLYTLSGGHLIADVSGWIPAGVYVPKTPTRVLDTRAGAEQVGYTGDKPGPGATVELQVAGVAGVPTTAVSAVVFNVTATEATAAGFVTVWPTGQERPTASSLNLEGAGATAPNQVTVPLGAGGKVSFYTLSGTHLIADLAGYYTESTGFTPLSPARILDTRPGPDQNGYTGDKPGAGATVSLAVAGRGGVPVSGAGAVVLNVTATDATAPGFITVWPGQTDRPNSSVLNLTYAGETRPNAVLVPLGADGTVNLFTLSGTHLVVDVAGWFPG